MFIQFSVGWVEERNPTTIWKLKVRNQNTINPTTLLKDTLKETVPWAIAVGSEKARAAGIINPVLLEVKRQLKGIENRE